MWVPMGADERRARTGGVVGGELVVKDARNGLLSGAEDVGVVGLSRGEPESENPVEFLGEIKIGVEEAGRVSLEFVPGSDFTSKTTEDRSLGGVEYTRGEMLGELEVASPL